MTDDDGYPLGINWETFVGDISVATPVFNWRARHRGGQRRRAHLRWKVSEVQWKLMPTTAHGAKSPPAALGYAGHHRFSLRTTSKRSNIAMPSEVRKLATPDKKPSKKKKAS